MKNREGHNGEINTDGMFHRSTDNSDALIAAELQSIVDQFAAMYTKALDTIDQLNKRISCLEGDDK